MIRVYICIFSDIITAWRKIHKDTFKTVTWWSYNVARGEAEKKGKPSNQRKNFSILYQNLIECMVLPQLSIYVKSEVKSFF